MPRSFIRSLPVLLALAAAVVAFAVLLPGGGLTVGTEAPGLAAPVREATPIEFIDGFAAALNAGDIDGVLANLAPDVAILYFPGLTRLAQPSVSEVRTAFELYRELDTTITVERCDESAAAFTIRTDLRTLAAAAAGSTVLDCSLVYSSSFARRIGFEEQTQLFMRFDVGNDGIGAMYLSPVILFRGD